jgi:2-polyprenyl-3-methyl-5-hydroxy-6-metoxy-1,4-benzoquinol methylase
MIKSNDVTEYFKNTNLYIHGNPIIELRKKVVHDLIGKPEGLQILDIGCGDGSLTIDFLRNNKITFLDITTEMLDLVRAKISNDNLENAQMKNISILDYNSETEYDIIICIGVFAHVSDLHLLTKKLESLLKLNGISIVQFTNSQSLVSIINRLKNSLLFRNPYKYSLNRHNTKEIEKLISSFGFRITQRTSYWPIAPFFSYLRKDLKERALLYFYRNKILSKFGSEKVFVLRRSIIEN